MQLSGDIGKIEIPGMSTRSTGDNSGLRSGSNDGDSDDDTFGIIGQVEEGNHSENSNLLWCPNSLRPFHETLLAYFSNMAVSLLFSMSMILIDYKSLAIQNVRLTVPLVDF